MASRGIDVVYEQGVFRPLEPVNLPEGSRARVYASDAITKTPGVCGGRACIGGTRITVWGLVVYRNQGLDAQAILAALPMLTPEQLLAAFRYAAENVEEIVRDIAESQSGG